MKILLLIGGLAVSSVAIAGDTAGLVITGPTRFAEATTQVTITSTPSGEIHYTLDGEAPTVDSPVYSGPITITNTVTIKAFTTDKSGNPVAATAFKTITRLVARKLAPGEWVKATEVLEMNGPRFDAKKEIIGWCENGGSLLFGPFQFAPGAMKAMEVEVGVETNLAGGKMHVRLDAVDGPAIGTFTFQSTGGFESFKIQSIPVKELGGDHTLFFVFEGDRGICNLKQFRLTNP